MFRAGKKNKPSPDRARRSVKWVALSSLVLLAASFDVNRSALADTTGPALDADLQAFVTSLEPEFKDPKKPKLEKNQAMRGKRNAPILLVEYSDFQCPYCQKGFTTVEELTSKYKNKLAFVFKNLPLPFHPLALPAAKRFAAIALQSAKKAYAYHDEVFKNQQQFVSTGETYLDDVAKKLKVNVEKMKKDMEGDKVKQMLEADRAEATSFDFTGTPGFLVNGVRIKGAYPTPVFEAIIERQLAMNKPAKKGAEKKAKEKKVKEAAPKADAAGEKAVEEKAQDEKATKESPKEEKPKEEKKTDGAPEKEKS